MTQQEKALECAVEKQVVPDFWYLVLQEKVPGEGAWREAGRLKVTRRTGSDTTETWHLYTRPQDSGGGEHGNEERIAFISLGTDPAPEKAALRLKRMGEAGRFEAPTGARNVITAECSVTTETFLK